jgi:signal transduction histidine kinase
MQRGLTVLACFLICAGCFAQQYPFVYYTPNDGLVNSRVLVIKQDSKGRMLFLTRGGLSIYDGKRFTNYTRHEGLENELVNDIVEVAPDSFLLATNALRLNTLVRGRVGIFKTADNFYPVINRFFHCSDGAWYAAADEGLFRLDTNRFTKIPLIDQQGNEMHPFLERIIEWKNYLVLVPWNQELREKMIVYNRVTRQVSDVALDGLTFTGCSGYNSQWWFYTNSALQSLDTAALNHGRIRFLPVPEKYRQGISRDVLVLFEGGKKIWFYNKGRLTVSTGRETNVVTLQQGHSRFFLTDLFLDREGIMWMSTDGNGVVKLRSTQIALLNQIDQQSVSCGVITKSKDTVWFYNQDNHSLYRYAGKFTVFPLGSLHTPIYNLYVRNRQLLLATHNRIFLVENKDDPASYRHIKTIFKTNDHVRFGHGIVTNDGVLVQYGMEDSSYMLFIIKGNRIVMKQQLKYACDQLSLDRMGRLWLTTRRDQVYAFSLHPEEPEKYLQLLNGYPADLPFLGLRAIVVDSNSHVWLGTRSHGLYHYEPRNDCLSLVAHYTTGHGLTDNFIQNLACDNNNTIWAGTQTGIDRIYRKNERYIIGNVSKSNNYFQAISGIITTNDNTVWALSNENILKISGSSSPSVNIPPPQLILTSMEVDNETRFDTLKSLSYQDNNLTFHVAAPSFIDERSIRYSYLLEGAGHHAWSTPSDNASFNFINLAPGNYTLRLRADFPETVYPSQFLSYAFSIRPPWWQTWWFRMLAAVILLAISALLVRSYIRRKLEKQRMILERQQAIERERTRIATDMHDDLGAGLSRIKFLSETIGIKKQMQEPVEEDIDKIREYSHEMIDKMGEIVWALNEKNDSLSDLLAYTRVYAVQYLSENGIECTVDTPTQFPSLFISGEFRRNIYLTVKEALHNVVKHAQARQVKIHIETGDSLLVSICDDGNGFDATHVRPHGNGLNNMKRRIESIDGTLQIMNGNGTIVVFSVPLR